jgi:hypothetical protein
LLIDVGPGRSLAFATEAGRQLGYRRLRGLRNRLRAFASGPRPKKAGLAATN